MQKHGSNLQSNLMGLVEGLVISCLVLVSKKRKNEALPGGTCSLVPLK